MKHDLHVEWVCCACGKRIGGCVCEIGEGDEVRRIAFSRCNGCIGKAEDPKVTDELERALNRTKPH